MLEVCKLLGRDEFSVTHNIAQGVGFVHKNRIDDFLSSEITTELQSYKDGAHVLLARAMGISASWSARRISRTSGKKSNSLPELPIKMILRFH